MDKLFTTKNKKITSTVGLAITGWSALAASFASFPAMPAIISKPLIAGISLLTVAGAVTAGTILMLWNDY